MKKKLIALGLGLFLIVGVIYVGVAGNSTTNYYANTKEEILLASAGKKENIKLLQEIDKAMFSVFKEIKAEKVPTDEELTALADKIEVLRGWGGDLTDKSRIILEQLTLVLKDKKQNRIEVLDRLDKILQEAVHLAA